MSNTFTRDMAAGWGYPPPRARKSHYFQVGDSESLCGKHGLYFGPREDYNHDSPDNCAECQRRRLKLTAKGDT